MLKEYLLAGAPAQAAWSDSMPGVQVCRFSLSGGTRDGMRTLPARGAPLHFEAFFCLGGRLAARPLRGEAQVVEAPGIFLLSDSSGLRSCLCSGDLSGILVTVDAKAAKESLMTVCSILGLELDTKRVREKMRTRSGCMALWDTPWAQALFEQLRCLPEAARERYCVFKAVELLYLFCAEHPSAEEAGRGTEGYVLPRMQEVRAYLQTHLSEKLTIGLLCREFSLSPTALKEGFRRAFGAPVHSWLVEQRIRRARELLSTTRMPIQQVALAVGYEGMSQFNAVFKRYYGMTPGQLRKMSETATPRPF